MGLFILLNYFRFAALPTRLQYIFVGTHSFSSHNIKETFFSNFSARLYCIPKISSIPIENSFLFVFPLFWRFRGLHRRDAFLLHWKRRMKISCAVFPTSILCNLAGFLYWVSVASLKPYGYPAANEPSLLNIVFYSTLQYFDLITFLKR